MSTDLEARVAQLEALVQKQQTMIVKSGEQIMKLSLSAQRDDINDLDKRNHDLRAQVNLPNEQDKQQQQQQQHQDNDYISQDDVVQLVEELQGQLDLVEKRSILRVENASSNGQISALPNIAGEEPFDFPSTVKEFEALDQAQIVQISRFYDLLPPDVEEIKQLLTEGNVPFNSKEGKLAIETAKQTESALDPKDTFNQLARYLGITVRK